MQPITIFRGTSGLNTVADPARIPMAKSGTNDVAEIVNMRVDQYNRPSRRPGFTLTQSGSFHSIFSNYGDCFVVQTRTSDDAIMRVESDGSLTGIASGLSKGRRMSWARYRDRTYFVNGVENGYIDGVTAMGWTAGSYFGPDTNRDFTVPTNITHIDIHKGRMFVSRDNLLFWSEPYRMDLFNVADCFAQFKTGIRMIKSVDGGVFVSTERNTHFLTGADPTFLFQRSVTPTF